MRAGPRPSVVCSEGLIRARAPAERRRRSAPAFPPQLRLLGGVALGTSDQRTLIPALVGAQRPQTLSTRCVAQQIPRRCPLLRCRKHGGRRVAGPRPPGRGPLWAGQPQEACCPHGLKRWEWGHDRRCPPKPKEAKHKQTNKQTALREARTLSCRKRADAAGRTGGAQRRASGHARFSCPLGPTSRNSGLLE